MDPVIAPAGQTAPATASSLLTNLLIVGGLATLGYVMFFAEKSAPRGMRAPVDETDEALASGKHTVLFVDKDDEDTHDFVIKGSIVRAAAAAKKRARPGDVRVLIYPGDHASVGTVAQLHRKRDGGWRMARG